MSRVSFNNNPNPFHTSLKEKVDNYFRETKLKSSGGNQLVIKGFLIVFTTFFCFTTLVFFTPGVLISIILCCILGLTLAAIGFNIMHEGGHGSFSERKWLNSISAYSLNIMGGTIHFWKQKHNINHHTYTNIEGMDHDINIKYMRMHEEQPRFWYHRFQHVYWVVLYGISYMAWILIQDFQKYFSGKMGIHDTAKKLNTREHFIFWFTKLCYICIYLVLPIVMVGVIKTLIGFMIVGFSCGYCISIVFQLAHVVEGTNFPEPDEETNKIEQEWAVHQIRTTANFATNCKMTSWFLGGLNFQVEHHLFPRISHVHYPHINKLVKQTCSEFNVPYTEFPTVLKAFGSHLSHIRKLGNS
ncbi:fatty acid desaturase family protein [Desertivirga xinjiangensis]|uniref:fatty acid desaturase family protein n=1 Tax=Desertivirga xinjiangensis TaxID=539206 RepID=UPI00210E0E6B|nr:acyl-CoA desaturase [Pedobacter xinjiangensis]